MVELRSSPWLHHYFSTELLHGAQLLTEQLVILLQKVL